MMWQPPFRRLVLVGGTVVENQMDLAVGVGRVQTPKKAQELLMAMAPVAFAVDLAGSDVEGGKEGDGDVALVVMGVALHLTRPRRQQGLRTVDGLHLALFVDAEVVPRVVEFEADDSCVHFYERGLVCQDEREVESPPSVLHGRAPRRGGLNAMASTGDARSFATPNPANS